MCNIYTPGINTQYQYGIGKIQCSLKNQPVPEELNMKEIVDEILESIKFKEKRARSMDIDDFMKLLHAFNSNGIHFV